MVIFITGRSGAGKTTKAYELANLLQNIIILDGDEVRKEFPTGFDMLSKKTHILRMAKMANILQKQNYTVIISAILPTKELRTQARACIEGDTELIYIPGGTMWENTNYEEPDLSENPQYLENDRC